MDRYVHAHVDTQYSVNSDDDDDGGGDNNRTVHNRVEGLYGVLDDVFDDKRH